MSVDPTNLEPHEFVDDALNEAIALGASDVYWLPGKDAVVLRFKIGGVQRHVVDLRPDYGTQCVTRLKVLANLLTYRTSVAQDGAIRGTGRFPETELRVGAMPTIHGERVTVRLLDQARVKQDLDSLGYAPETLVTLRRLLSHTSGMLVLTGPTGSGKTTTIYAMVRELLRTGADPATIITIEDPVETDFGCISQVQVSRSGEEWGYAHALRAALRHDVKTLIIGEMRDRDVVKVALDAALTGHRVITTYHAGDIPSVYARLLHQGFEPFLVAAAVTGVLTQRLVKQKDSDRLIPIAAMLEATDSWRDFVVANPALGELRSEVRAYPGADLSAIAAGMVAEGLIHEREEYLL